MRERVLYITSGLGLVALSFAIIALTSQPPVNFLNAIGNMALGLAIAAPVMGGAALIVYGVSKESRK